MPEYNFGGQKIFYNPERKVVRTVIAQPFYKAGKILSWNPSVAGIGLNKQIIDFVQKTHSNLIVRVESAQSDFYIKPDKLKEFIKNNNTDYLAGGHKPVKVIAWNQFIGYHSSMEKLQNAC